MKYLKYFLCVTGIGFLLLLIFQVIPMLISSADIENFFAGVLLLIVVLTFVVAVFIDYFNGENV